MKQLFLLTGLIFLILMLLVYFLQRSFMYFPAKEIPSLNTFHAEDMQVIRFTTEDGLQLRSWYKSALPDKPTILYLHGNAGHIGYRMPLVRQLLRAGFGVLLLEYRGYGGNPGKPTEQGLYKDSLAALYFLQQQGISLKQIALYGESLGTGLAFYLAQNRSFCAIVLQSPYTSMTALARYHYPWIFFSPKDKFDSLAKISDVKSPMLILHGKNDSIVPYKQAEILFQQANEPKKLIGLPGKSHNDLWNDTFVSQVISFIQSYCTVQG